MKEPQLWIWRFGLQNVNSSQKGDGVLDVADQG
jgi:hypothetical protein